MKKQTLIQVVLILIFTGIALFIRNQMVGGLFKSDYEKNTEILNTIETQSSSIYIYNLSDEEVLYEKNPDENTPPASLTKLMPLLLTLETVGDLDKPAPIYSEVYYDMVQKNASMAGFFANETTTYRDLVIGALLPSGGECAGSLALHIGQTNTYFVDSMNQKAQELGMTKTQYINPVGLDEEGHQSTAKDTYVLFRKLLENDLFRQMITEKSILSSSTNVHPNGLELDSYFWTNAEALSQEGFTLIGGKTGTTLNAGLCLAVLVEKDGKEIILVSMNYPFEDLSNPGVGHLEEAFHLIENLEV